jgi:hypothetical protein
MTDHLNDTNRMARLADDIERGVLSITELSGDDDGYGKLVPVETSRRMRQQETDLIVAALRANRALPRDVIERAVYAALGCTDTRFFQAASKQITDFVMEALHTDQPTSAMASSNEPASSLTQTAAGHQATGTASALPVAATLDVDRAMLELATETKVEKLNADVIDRVERYINRNHGGDCDMRTLIRVIITQLAPEARVTSG